MNFDKIRLGIFGCGAWGINHVRTARELLGKNLAVVCDVDPKSRAKVHGISQEIPFTERPEDLLGNSEINAVVVATPAETHFSIAKKCLEANKHVLVEKPLTLQSQETAELVALARKQDRKLMVGHVLLYHPAILKIKKMIAEQAIGQLQYIYSNRLNLGAIRSEENSLWSFAPHDVSIIQFLTDSSPVGVKASGAAFLQPHIEDTTLTYLTYPNNVHAHIFVSWLHPFKEHRLVVIGDRGMVVFEDSLKADKLKFYKKGFKHANGKLEKFDADFEIIPYEALQPLTEEHRHFYESILNNQKPRTDGEHALDVLQILEKAQRSLKQHDESI